MIKRLLFCGCVVIASASAFSPARSRGERRLLPSVALQLVTEADVITLVEKAEDLWARVQTLRNEADELSARAEGLGREAETSAADAVDSLRGSISEAKIEEANEAQNSCIDLGALLDEAVRANEEADRIEALAEEALADSNVALEQHIVDFPEDDEIDTL